MTDANRFKIILHYSLAVLPSGKLALPCGRSFLLDEVYTSLEARDAAVKFFEKFKGRDLVGVTAITV